MPGPPIGTVTFLCTDIEGSTALLQLWGDTRYAEALADHRRILRAVFLEQGGRELESAGDAFLVAFARARDAVVAAVAAQLALKKHRWPEDANLQIRMGMHTGEPITVAKEYVGLDVHRTARICGAAHGGQILLSLTTSSLVEGFLPSTMGLRDLGPHRLKDLHSEENLFQIVHPGLETEFPPIKALDAGAGNLPHQLSSFIGRAQEIAEVKRLLPATRLLTLTGPGGCGKTRLAIQVATDVMEAYSAGIWLVELAALGDPRLVPQTVASAVGVREAPRQQLRESLVDHLRRKKLLLVLDNCEHLLEACGHLAETLLSACEDLRVLATSREALGIPGEITWRVPSLSLPQRSAPPTADTVARYDAIRLFIERATAVQSTFTLTAKNAGAVVEVCRHLDGIPLAIELAAARVAALPVEEIAARLSDRFALLSHGRRTAPPRHRTLQAAIDWSYHLLSGAEQRLLCQLSVFTGGWTLEAAEAVCRTEGSGPYYVMDVLTELVMKSLVLPDEQQGSMRYRLLETVREYAFARLAASGEVAGVKERHLDWYVTLAERAAPELVGASQLVWFDRFETEYDNLRGALEWSLQSGRSEAGLRFMGAIWRFWYVRGHFGEGRRWLEALLHAGGTASDAIRAEALKAAGNLAVWGQADYTSGRALYQESLVLWRKIGDKRGIAAVLGNLAFVAVGEGDLEAERALLEESLALRREVDDKGGIALALHSLGRMAFRQGDHVKARALLSESLPIWLQLEDKQAIAMVLENLGLLASREGAYAEARALLADSLAIRRELGHKAGIAYTLEGFAGLAAAQGQALRAARVFGAAEALRDTIGVPLLPPDRPDYDRYVAAARSGVSAEAFAAEWARGRGMSLEEAIAQATGVEQETHGTQGSMAADIGIRLF